MCNHRFRDGGIWWGIPEDWFIAFFYLRDPPGRYPLGFVTGNRAPRNPVRSGSYLAITDTEWLSALPDISIEWNQWIASEPPENRQKLWPQQGTASHSNWHEGRALAFLRGERPLHRGRHSCGTLHRKGSWSWGDGDGCAPANGETLLSQVGVRRCWEMLRDVGTLQLPAAFWKPVKTLNRHFFQTVSDVPFKDGQFDDQGFDWLGFNSSIQLLHVFQSQYTFIRPYNK